MRSALLTARKHGEETLSVLIGPADPHSIGQEFKRLLGEPGDLAELQLWDSGSGITKRKRFSVPVAPPPSPPSEKTLEEHTIEELRALAEEEGIDLAGLSLKADILAAIALAKTPLAERTIAQLRELAAAEDIDLTGLSRKDDIVAALELARTAPQSHETPAAEAPGASAAESSAAGPQL